MDGVVDSVQTVYSIHMNEDQGINPTQHCTSEECDYTLSHTAQWCGYEQPRRCGCAFCYPEDQE